jgi:hypothetical protein
MSFLVRHDTKSDQILGSRIAQSAPRLNVTDLKILHTPASLATPDISLQAFSAELAIRFGVKRQPWPFSPEPPHCATWLFSTHISNLSSTNEPLGVRRHLCLCEF